MSAGPLTSNHVNYLIWRYLQESGHGQAAVRLQRDWGLDPETLPFARHIGTHALISLVQKGLQYHEIEKSLDQARRVHGTQTSPSPSVFFFGPGSAQPPTSPNDEMDEDEAVCTSRSSPRPRKHAREATANGAFSDQSSQAPAPKRSRRSNGAIATTTNGDSMDLDHNGYSHGALGPKRDAPEPVPLTAATAAGGMELDADGDVDVEGDVSMGMGMGAGMGVGVGVGVCVGVDAAAEDYALQEQPTPIVALTLTNGRSVGVQSDKLDRLAELGPETVVLSAPDANRHVTHTAWNPRDPALLATGGEALCRIWNLSRSTSPDNPNGNSYIDLVEPFNAAIITSMAWSADGEFLAVAARSDDVRIPGTVAIHTKAGTIHDELPGGDDWVLNLSWNPSGSLLLGVTHFDDVDSTLIVWDLRPGQAMHPFEMETALLDATWIDDRRFMVCGLNLIGESVINGQNILDLRTRAEPETRHNWTKIRHDRFSNTTAVFCEETGVLGIIDPSGRFHHTKAHDDDITGLMYQPLSNPSAHYESSPRLLATSSADGFIKIWNARKPMTIMHTLCLGRSSPAMAMSFTPDGYFVAGASWNKILIWNAESGGIPKATWKGKVGEWQSESVVRLSGFRGQMEDEDPTHSLSWDLDGGKLAYGLRSQIAVINFRR